MGARLLNYKDNRAANSMSAEKLQPCHAYRLLEISTNAASFIAGLDLNGRTPLPARLVQMVQSPDELHVAIKIGNEKS